MSVFICRMSTLCRILEFDFYEAGDVLMFLHPDDVIKRLYRENVRAYCEWHKIPKTSDQYKELMMHAQEMRYSRSHHKYTPFHRFSATECWLYQCRNVSLQHDYDKNGDLKPASENIILNTRENFDAGSYVLAVDLIRKNLVPPEYRDIGPRYAPKGDKTPVDVIHYYMEQNNIRPFWR